ncbi:unnamed protein product, partial [Prorocentrum cordatum]
AGPAVVRAVAGRPVRGQRCPRRGAGCQGSSAGADVRRSPPLRGLLGTGARAESGWAR